MYLHHIEPEVRRHVELFRPVPKFGWHFLQPGDLVRLDGVSGTWFVVSRVRMSDPQGDLSRKEWTRLVLLGDGPRLRVHDV